MPKEIATNADLLPATYALRFHKQGILLAIVVIGACLRLLLISHQSFWYDEAMAAQFSQHSAAELLTGAVRDNGNPPLYWILLHFWSRCVGSGDGALRMLSVVFGVLCIPLTYVIGQRVATDKIATMAALFCAVSPYQVYLSQEARTYTLFVLMGMLSAFSLLRSLDRPELARYWILYACSTCAMLYAHYYALFMIAAEATFIYVHPNRSRAVLLRALASLCIAGIGFLPWLPTFLVQLHTPGNLSRSAGTWWMHAVATPFIFGFGRTLIWKQNITPVRIALSAVGGLVLVATLARGLWAARRIPGSLFLYLWITVDLGLPWAVSTVMSPLYAERYGALASIPYYFFVAYGLYEWKGGVRWMCCIAISAACVTSLGFYYSSSVKDDWRNAVRYVEACSQRGDLLLFDVDFDEISYARYATQHNQRLRILAPPYSPHLIATDHAGGLVSDAAPTLSLHSRVWLILSGADADLEPQYRKYFSTWNWSPKTSVHGINIWLLQQPNQNNRRPASLPV